MVRPENIYRSTSTNFAAASTANNMKPKFPQGSLASVQLIYRQECADYSLEASIGINKSFWRNESNAQRGRTDVKLLSGHWSSPTT